MTNDHGSTDDLNPLEQRTIRGLKQAIIAAKNPDSAYSPPTPDDLARALFDAGYRKLTTEPDPGRRHRLVKLATVDLNTWVVTFDGDPFPYYMAQEGVDVEGLGDPNAIPVVRFGVLAETVHVIPKEPKP